MHHTIQVNVIAELTLVNMEFFKFFFKFFFLITKALLVGQSKAIP